MFTDFARAGCSCEHCDPIRWHPTTPGCWWWPSCLLPAVASPWCWHHSAWCCESITIDEGWEVRVPGHVNIRGNPVADSAVQDVLDLLSPTISSLSNIFCTYIWLNSWKQITSNWHSRFVFNLFHIVIPADKQRLFYPNYVVTFHMISTPFCWKENCFFPSSLCLCVPRLCPDTIFRRYQMHLPQNLFSLSVHNTLAQCMYATFIKVYILDKTRIRPPFLLNHHLLPKAPI